MLCRDVQMERERKPLQNEVTDLNPKCLDGTKFMFRKATQSAEKSGKYARVFELYDAVKTRPKIKAYLASDKRQEYSLGLYRYYPELDVEDDV